MTDTALDAGSTRRPWIFAVFLIVTGALGWWAAFSLTLDKFAVLENPEADLDCNFSLLVQCGVNLSSPQGAVFGFPNPLLGLGGFVAPIAIGVGLLAGARFARWFWVAFNVGVAGALAFVIWLIAQSVFVLGTLCPWCMLVWSVVIPLFWAVTARNLAAGAFGERALGAGRFIQSWIVPIVIVSYAVVALLAQVRLDVIGHIAAG
ncbi:vitamin K epoxide reductase family protein [soil metagenome]